MSPALITLLNTTRARLNTLAERIPVPPEEQESPLEEVMAAVSHLSAQTTILVMDSTQDSLRDFHAGLVTLCGLLKQFPRLSVRDIQPDLYHAIRTIPILLEP